MTTLTEKFASFEGQVNDDATEAHSQRESIITTLEDIQTGIASINSDMLLLKQALLTALSQQDPFACCTPPSIVTPPTDTTVHPVDEDRCKRVQAFLHAMHEITGVFGAATDSGIFWSPSVVIGGINEVVTTLISGGTVPLPSLPEAVNIAGDAINYGLSNIGRGDNLQSQFDSISSAMVNGLYLVGSPDATQAQYASMVSGSSLPNDEKLLFTALGFNALFSYFFDPGSTPDLSGYSGTACLADLTTITTCVDIASTAILDTDGFTRHFLIAPPASAFPQETAGDFFGFSFKILSGDDVVGHNLVRRPVGGGARTFVTSISVGATWTLADHTSTIALSTDSPSHVEHPFVVRICPPAS